MIRIGHYRDSTDIRTFQDVTFGEAVNDLLSEFVRFEHPSVRCGIDFVMVTAYTTNEPAVTYGTPPDDSTDYVRLTEWAKVLNMLIVQHRDERLGYVGARDIDKLVTVASFTTWAGETITPTCNSYHDYKAIVHFAIQWLLKRQIADLPMGSVERFAATCTALQRELDSGAPFEETVVELLAG